MMYSNITVIALMAYQRKDPAEIIKGNNHFLGATSERQYSGLLPFDRLKKVVGEKLGI